MSANPYAAPRAALESHAAGGYWREGKLAVLHPGGTLPARCIKCNERAVQPMKTRKLYWHHSAWYLLFLVNAVIYVVIALIIRKKAEVTYGLCEHHQNRRRLFSAIGWIGFFVGFALIFVTPVLGLITTVSAIIAGVFGSRLAYPSRITKEEVRLAGCGEAFLASLENDAAPAQQSLPKRAPPPARAGLGKCPNCAALVPADAAECIKCRTALGPNTVLPVRA
jgi:hypothetical protein